jgi:hypothetical protein
VNAAELIQVIGDCAFCRPVGTATLEVAVVMTEQAIQFARVRNLPKLFFNAERLTGFPSPSLPERYFLSRRFATAAAGQVQLAMVVRREMIDPEKFGIQVARNAGMNADVFDNEPEALLWLQPLPRSTKP